MPSLAPPALTFYRPIQHMINDSMSWGSVEDPIGTLLRRAAFYVVEHPSPATKAELAAAREKDLVAKVSRSKSKGERRGGKFSVPRVTWTSARRCYIPRAPIDGTRGEGLRVRTSKVPCLTPAIRFCVVRVETFGPSFLLPFCVGLWWKKEQPGEADRPRWKVQTSRARARGGTGGACPRTGETQT